MKDFYGGDNDHTIGLAHRIVILRFMREINTMQGGHLYFPIGSSLRRSDLWHYYTISPIFEVIAWRIYVRNLELQFCYEKMMTMFAWMIGVNYTSMQSSLCFTYI